MIKKRENIDEKMALQEACRENDIILSERNTNKNPVAYIDTNGIKRQFSTNQEKREGLKAIKHAVVQVNEDKRILVPYEVIQVTESNRESLQALRKIGMAKRYGVVRKKNNLQLDEKNKNFDRIKRKGSRRNWQSKVESKREV